MGDLEVCALLCFDTVFQQAGALTFDSPSSALSCESNEKKESFKTNAEGCENFFPKQTAPWFDDKPSRLANPLFG
jgi:hypothetical protein